MCLIGRVLQQHQEIQVKLVPLPWIVTERNKHEDSACLCSLLQTHLWHMGIEQYLCKMLLRFLEHLSVFPSKP